MLRQNLSVKGSAIFVIYNTYIYFDSERNLGLRGGRAKHDLNVREVWNYNMYQYILNLCDAFAVAVLWHDLSV